MTAGARSSLAAVDEVVPFRIPLRIRFRRVDVREGVLLHGPAGWGEWSPFPEYAPALASRWLAAALEAAVGAWPRVRRDRIEVNAIVPAVGPDEAAALVRASGCRTAKVKVAERGQPPDDDLARVEAVRDALGPDGRIRIDANAAWDVDEAVRRLRALSRFGLEYAEQPCAALHDLVALRRRVDVPLAVDEALRLADQPHAVASAVRDAADVVILKVQPLGGIRRCLALADACGLPVVVSSAVETSVGLAAGLALAAALPTAPLACGLGTATLLEGDVVHDALVPVDGALDVRRPQPSAELVERWALLGRPAEAVVERLRQAADALAGRVEP